MANILGMVGVGLAVGLVLIGCGQPVAGVVVVGVAIFVGVGRLVLTTVA
jgi:hypothetical protein